jgi:hypothetical protein
VIRHFKFAIGLPMPLLRSAVLLLLLAASAFPQKPSPFRPVEPVDTRRTPGSETGLPPRVEERVQTFFTALTTQTPEQAFFRLFEGTKFATEKDVIDAYTQATRNEIASSGKIKFFNHFETRKIGNRLILSTHIVEHERRLMRWRLMFYSPVGNEWKLINLKVDDLRNFHPANPSPARPPEAVALKIEKFFILLQSGDPAAAFAEITAGTDLATKKDLIDAFISRTQQAAQEHGKIASYEILDNRPLNPRHRLLTCLAATEREPLRWQFFYKVDPQNGSWLLQNVRVDDLFDESFLID